MANDVRSTHGFSYEKDNLKGSVPNETSTYTLTGTRANRTNQTIGTTYEAIVTGDLASAGLCWVKNLSTSNYVEIGREVSGAFYGVVLVLPGKSAGPFGISTLSLFGRANTAAVDIDILITEAVAVA